MPELPEVQTIVAGLKKIVGKTVADLEVRLPRRFYFQDMKPSQSGSGLSQRSADEIVSKLKGEKIKEVQRRGKLIVIRLESFTILIHLKLTGQLIYKEKQGKRTRGGDPTRDMVGELPTKATHFIFHFTDSSQLFFNDFRKFGYLHLFPTTRIDAIPTVRKLGIDPLSRAFNSKFLKTELSKRAKLTIKQFLMDQEIIAGIGNIYSDEGLFWAKVKPTRKNSKIKDPEIKKIVLGIRKALKLGLKYQGASDATYRKVDGSLGLMQKHFSVYQRAKKPCKVCKTKVERVKISGRSSHFCPKCQK